MVLGTYTTWFNVVKRNILFTNLICEYITMLSF